MKKLVLSVFVILFSLMLRAQDSITHHSPFRIGKVSGGAMFTIAGTAGMPWKSDKPFDLWYQLSPSFNVFTGKTHHHVMYGIGNNTMQTLDGYFLGKDWDAYLFYAQNLHDFSKRYAAIGIEKVFPAGDHAKFVLLCEGGTDCKGGSSFTIGVVIHPQCTLWKR